jgi:hypothetical protein
MNSFKRQLYKNNSIKKEDTGPVRFFDWRASTLDKVYSYCKQITTPFYKSPNQSDISVGDIFFADPSQSSLFTNIEAKYTVSLGETLTPENRSSITGVTLNEFSEVTEVVAGQCEQTDEYAVVGVTAMYDTRLRACISNYPSALINILQSDLDDIASSNLLIGSIQLYKSNLDPIIDSINEIGIAQGETQFAREVVLLVGETNRYSVRLNAFGSIVSIGDDCPA